MNLKKEILVGLVLCFVPCLANGFESGNGKTARTPDGKIVSREKAEDEIAVSASGNLKIKGIFYLKEGTGLKFFYWICGGHGGEGDFGGGPPVNLKIARVVDGKQQVFRIKFKDLHLAKTADFELLDGDVVLADERIF